MNSDRPIEIVQSLADRVAPHVGERFLPDYAYDLAGNRTQTVINGVTNIYTLGLGNRLSHCSSGAQPPETTLAYAYDLAGNVTNIADAAGTRELVWDGQYRLTGVSTNGVLAESYGYDPLGRRAWTFDGSVTNWHVHDGMHVIADLDDAGGVLRSYTWGPGIDNLLAITVHGASGTNTFYAITDHLGTVHALSDETGAIVESYRFDAWGNVLGIYDGSGSPLSRSAIGNHYLHQGRWYSWSTGYYCHRARWRDPETGRWLSNDPIGINGGLNQYVAFGNNPVINIDPLGEDWLDAAANFSAGFGDTISFGLTGWVRRRMGTDDVVRRGSGWYRGGIAAGVAHGVVMGGAGMTRAGSHGLRGSLYEIGQKTLTRRQYQYFTARNANPVRRGIDIVRHQGWVRARLPSPSGLLTQSWRTVGTGLTPMAGEGVAVLYGTAQAVYGAYQLYDTYQQDDCK